MSRTNVSQYFGKGLSPEQFMEGMEKNKEAFRSGYDQFVWSSEEDREFFESLNHRDDLRVLILVRRLVWGCSTQCASCVPRVGE